MDSNAGERTEADDEGAVEAVDADEATDAAARARRDRRRLAAALTVAGLGVAAIAVVAGLTLTTAGRTEAGGSSSTSTSPSSSDADSSGASSGAPDEIGGEADAPAAPGPQPQATPVPGSEVLEPDAGAVTDGVPPLTPEPPLVSGPLPGDDAADGRLVTGYPTDVAGPADGDTVVSSSVASEGDTMQASLTARSDSTPDTVRAHFEQLWTSRGLAPEGVDVPDIGADGLGEVQVTYRTETAAVTLAARSTGTGTVYSVFAVLRAG